MTEHTPTPWRVQAGSGNSEEAFTITTSDRVIASVAGEGYANRQANAAFIVRAANSHTALVAALRSAIDCVDEQATVIQELRSGGLATVAIPGWYLDAKKLLEEVLR